MLVESSFLITRDVAKHCLRRHRTSRRSPWSLALQVRQGLRGRRVRREWMGNQGQKAHKAHREKGEGRLARFTVA